MADKEHMVGIGRYWLLKASFLVSFLGITACSDGKPQVDFLKSLTSAPEQSGITLKINGSVEAWSQSPSPVVEISGFSNASKVEIFTSSTCDLSAKTGEMTATSSDTLLTVNAQTLSTEGSYLYYAQVTSDKGVAGPCSTQKATYHYDVTAPAVPSGIVLVTTTHNVATPVLRVEGVEVGATAFIYKDNTCTLDMGSAAASSSTVSVTSSAVSEGSYNYFARTTDAAGNSSACTSISATYIYDITPPAAPNTLALSTGVSSPDSNSTPTVDVGGLVAGDNVKIYSDLLCLTEVGSAPSAGTSMTVTTTLTTDGTYEFHAKAVDLYGNASDCSTVSVPYVLDRTPPTAPTSLSLSFPASSPSSVSTPQIEISPVTTGDTVNLFSDSNCTSLISSGVAISSSAVLTSNTLSSPGVYQYYAQAVDPVGNASSCSTATLSYQYDNAAPSITSVTSSNSNKTHGPGAEISIQINLNEVVSVSTAGGTPALTLNTSPTRTATYSSGSGSNVLTFTYVVQPGDSATDLDYYNSSALSLNSGTIQDAAGNALNSALPTPSSAESLGGSKNITIVGAPPLVRMMGSPTMVLKEDAGSATVELSLGYETFYPITVHVMTYGNALSGTDYLLSTDTVVFAAGTTTANFNVTVYDNGIIDSPRKLKLSVDIAGGSHGALINRVSQKDIYIVDNDDASVSPPALLGAGSTGSHSCLLRQNGSIKCWGNNSSGQLGDNSQVDSLIPTLLYGATNNYTQAAVGGSHTCALQNDQTLWCWGYGGKGALGNGSTTTTKVPTQVSSLITYRQVAAGAGHTCAIQSSDDTLWCFGDNAKKQLGGSTNSQELSPVQADSSNTFSMVAAGESHTCGITMAGALRCWGSNVYGQIGVGSFSLEADPPLSPTTVDSGTNYSKVAAGAYHTCAITTGGLLKCWGNNYHGQLGIGSTTSSSSPVTVSSLTGVVDIVIGVSHTCALLSNDDVKCWGDNTYGQIGQLTDPNSASPMSVFTSDITSTDVVSLSGGAYHTCAIFGQTGEVRCWGYNNVGQLGTGTDYRIRTASTVENNFSRIASGNNHSCGITSSGSVRCWGTNSLGQLGDGTSYFRSSPVEVIPSGALKVAVGEFFSCAVLSGGKLQCWGYNGSSRLGDGTTTSRIRPTTIISSGVADVALGVDHGCALMSTGEVQCWGDNTYGKVGNNSGTTRTSPVQVIASGATQISVSSTHSCAVVNSNLYCWGDNTYGQFGNGTSTSSSTPIQTLSNVSYIAVGESYSCGLMSSYLYCWGKNSSYQLGTGGTTGSLTPIKIDNTNTYTQISANFTHTCAIDSTNKLRCWGQNNKYQLSNSGSGLTTPTLVTSDQVLHNSVGYYHTCFINTSNELKCMGTNISGQLGLGDLSSLKLPLHVFGL